MVKSRIKFFLLAAVCTYALAGCTNKINETGSGLVGVDPALYPRLFNSDSLGVRVTSSQTSGSIVTSSSTEQSVGSVPWTEAELLLEFYNIDSVYYASTITSAQVILTRAPYVLQPRGYDVHNLQFAGYEMDSTWSSAYTWDSVAVAHRGASNIVVGRPVIGDSLITINIDTGVARQWATATYDSSVKNNGFLLIPQNLSGIPSIYSSISSYIPKMVVACTINGVPDTVTSTSSSSVSVAHTIIANVVPAGPYRFIQGGTGLREKLIFDLTHIPNLSIVNYAQLTLFADTLDTLYAGNSSDSLYAYHITDPSTNAVDYSYPSTLAGHKYTFNVTVAVQEMLNTGNYGFLITCLDETGNVDARFIYDENAPDSLKPRLTITYSPAVSKK